MHYNQPYKNHIHSRGARFIENGRQTLNMDKLDFASFAQRCQQQPQFIQESQRKYNQPTHKSRDNRNRNLTKIQRKSYTGGGDPLEIFDKMLFHQKSEDYYLPSMERGLPIDIVNETKNRYVESPLRPEEKKSNIESTIQTAIQQQTEMITNFLKELSSKKVKNRESQIERKQLKERENVKIKGLQSQIQFLSRQVEFLSKNKQKRGGNTQLEQQNQINQQMSQAFNPMNMMQMMNPLNPMNPMHYLSMDQQMQFPPEFGLQQRQGFVSDQGQQKKAKKKRKKKKKASSKTKSQRQIEQEIADLEKELKSNPDLQSNRDQVVGDPLE